MGTRTMRRAIEAVALCVSALLFLPPSSAVGQQTIAASKVRVTLTSRWAKPSTDPVGLDFHRARGRLLVVDSEVEETPRWAHANIWITTLGGRVTRSWSLTRFSIEPTDIAFVNKATMFVVDDNQDRIFRIRRGPDATWGTRDDTVRSFSTRPFGSRDPEGLEAAKGSLWVTDGNAARVYRILPGPNGIFNGFGPEGDDVVRSFGTLRLGLRDPEDIAYDGKTHLLLLISRLDDVIVRTNLRGQLVDQIDISPFGLINPAGITIAPGSSDPLARHIYVSDRGIDNDLENGGKPLENDGRIFEFALS